MATLPAEALDGMLARLRASSIHLETRDAYGTAVELPHMARWLAGDRDDLLWLEGWCQTVRRHVAAGRTVRRARVVSEPLSDYQRWSYGIAWPMVEAGEDIRWVPRRLVSTLAIPGNDFYVIDDGLVVFLHYAGNGLAIDLTTSTDPATLGFCRSAFDAVWELAIRHRDYQPV